MGISVPQLLIILAIVILFFGTKRLRNLGGDLGAAIKGFRSAVKEEDKQISEEEEGENTFEHDVASKQKEKSEK